MKVGIIADIHSNAPALEAVLNDLSLKNVGQIVHLGDAFNGPIDPVGVADLLRERQTIHVQGNGERMVLSDDSAVRSRSAEYARQRLSVEDLAWIRAWPTYFDSEDIFACHGTPASDTEYLLEDVTMSGVRLRSVGEVRAQLGSIKASLILCAHSHVPRLVELGGRVSVLNPGSVGLPAYSLDSPIRHTMETGSPHARYAIAERRGLGWHVEHVAVSYDHMKAAATAEQEGFLDWVAPLKSGYAL
ncbi:MAG: metallophosphoesterase family protein [Opitutus sp.]